ncbi:MAG: radical SAM protein, partial [Thermoflexales bacterium]|nr:radical SAM protein [Thermoflexales bacterium]
ITLLKTLLSSACERDCYYCACRAGRDCRRMAFSPDEFARAFDEMVHRRVVEGLFLSSGVSGGGVRTQDRLIATAELLRGKYHFAGYIHLKLMPGAESDQILRAMQLANRVSVNLEAPNTERLARLAPHKVFLEELLRPLQEVERLRQAWRRDLSPLGGGPSLVTQFVVGGADETDRELLTTAASLIRQLRLARIYFSAFKPIPDTPLQDRPPGSPLREHRLYQSDFLLRQYGFDVDELVLDASGNLPLAADPKLGWARVHLAPAPIELNRADRAQLLRVPGIGPKRAELILSQRRSGKLRELADLRKLGVSPERAAPFILLDGRRPPYQLSLWPEE